MRPAWAPRLLGEGPDLPGEHGEAPSEATPRSPTGSRAGTPPGSRWERRCLVGSPRTPCPGAPCLREESVGRASPGLPEPSAGPVSTRGCGSPAACTLWPGLQTLWALHSAHWSPSWDTQKWPWSQPHTVFAVLEHFCLVTRPMSGPRRRSSELCHAHRTGPVPGRSRTPGNSAPFRDPSRCTPGSARTYSWEVPHTGREPWRGSKGHYGPQQAGEGLQRGRWRKGPLNRVQGSWGDGDLPAWSPTESGNRSVMGHTPRPGPQPAVQAAVGWEQQDGESPWACRGWGASSCGAAPCPLPPAQRSQACS